MNILKLFLNIFIPVKCPICLKWIDIKEEKPVCKECLNKLRLEAKHKAIKDTDIFSIAVYEGEIQKLLHDFKYNKNLYLGKFLSLILSENIDPERYSNFNLIIPVPLHKEKLKDRGFNQSEIFADAIGKKLNIPVSKNILVRKIKTLPQVNMKKEEREKNVKDAFKCKKEIHRKNIILVDDVFTTGSTVKECIKELKKKGAEKINVIVFACA